MIISDILCVPSPLSCASMSAGGLTGAPGRASHESLVDAAAHFRVVQVAVDAVPVQDRVVNARLLWPRPGRGGTPAMNVSDRTPATPTRGLAPAGRGCAGTGTAGRRCRWWPGRGNRARYCPDGKTWGP